MRLVPMPPDSLGGRALTAVVLVTLIVACDKPPAASPTSPTSPTGPTGSTTPSISVELSGPDRLAPGQSAQYTVIVHSSDLVSRSPTSIQWIASPPSFLQVDASGLATGGPSNGGAAVTADVTIAGPGGGVKRASKSVLVLPEGTYFLFGTVADAELRTAPIAGARLEVTPGPALAITDSTGYFRLYGVPPDAHLRVTADGYEPWEQNLAIGADGRQDFLLKLSAPRLNLAGSYTLTVDAAAGCSFPAALQHRSYDALVTQSGVTLVVALTEPRFSLDGSGHGNHFSGHVDPAGATFTLGGFASDWGLSVYPDLAERLPDGRVLVVSGTPVTTGSAAGLSGTLNFGLSLWDSRFPGNDSSWLGDCGGGRFTLTPR